MKKIIMIISILISIIMLMGCGSKMNNSAEMYVNGELVDERLVSFEQTEHKGKTVVMIPVVKLFESIGYTVTWTDEHNAVIERDDLRILLDLKTHRLDVDDEHDHWDRFTLMPGDTEEDFIVREEDHELLVCSDYVQSAFELLLIDIEISADFNNSKVLITSDGVYHAPPWLAGKPK